MRGTETSAPVPSEMARLDQIILSGLARARSGGGSFPAQFSGLSFEAVGDGECTVRLGPAPQVLGGGGGFAAAAIAMLCDYSLSGAARSRVGRAATTPTVTLQIEYGIWPLPASDIICRSVFRGWLGKLATTTATLETAEGARLGSAYGRFLVQERTATTGFPRYPWETISEPPLALSQLTASERQARSFLLSHAASSPEGPSDGVLSYEQPLRRRGRRIGGPNLLSAASANGSSCGEPQWVRARRGYGGPADRRLPARGDDRSSAQSDSLVKLHFPTPGPDRSGRSPCVRRCGLRRPTAQLRQWQGNR